MPWFADENISGDARQIAPATERNRVPILAVLQKLLIGRCSLLEIASGSGEHALYFARNLPDVGWQPSDISETALNSIAAWRAEEGMDLPNLKAPIKLQIGIDSWPEQAFDAIFAANITHITPIHVTRQMFGGASAILGAGGLVILYGPFFRENTVASEGDLEFDANLRARDTQFGIRHVRDINAIADAAGFDCQEAVPMPANNLTLVYRLR